MSTNTPSPNSNQSSPMVSFLRAVAFIVGVPGAVAFGFKDIVTKDLGHALLLLVLYECSVLVLSLFQDVWVKLKDKWSTGIANWIDDLIQKRNINYKSYYARFLTFQHRDFDIKGLSTQSIYTLELERVFVDLSIDPMPLGQISSNPIPSQIPKKLPAGSRSLWYYLTEEPLKDQHLVLLGPPGSGKTTLFKHLALNLVNSKKARLFSQNIKYDYHLPFLLFLRDYAEAIHENPFLSLVEAIQTLLKRWPRPAPEGWVKQQLSKGKCLILLDGLDEVGDASLCGEVAEWVQLQMKNYALNRFLISSRPFGYRDNPLSGAMLLEVQPFTSKQVKRFVYNWYLANEAMSSQKYDPGIHMRADAGAQDLVQLIEQSSPLSSMAINPLLLTMISTIHRYGNELPGKRVELYAEICDVFLEKHQKAHNIKVDLSHTKCISVLQPLAYEMMAREQREVAAQDAQEMIKKPLELVDDRMTPAYFLQMVEHRSGLLLKREQGIYYFAHQTFQEYLAATYICNQSLEGILIAHLDESWWEETTRLYCAQADATNVIEACLKRATGSVRHLSLALECLVEAFKVKPTTKSQIGRVLEQGIEYADLHWKNSVAEILLERRLEEMILIQEGVYRDTSLILCAEYQLFLDEQRALGKYYQPDHWLNTQLPVGQALSPIIGVRPSAAQAFCQWLTERDQQGLWQYRLSRHGEYRQMPLHIRLEWLPLYVCNSPLGYWQEKGFALEWMQHLAGEALQKPLDVSLDLDSVASGGGINGEMPEKTTERMNTFASRDIDLSSAQGRTHASKLALANAIILALNLDLAGTNTLISALTNASHFAYDDILAHASDLAHASAFALDLAHMCVLTINPTHISDLADVNKRTHESELAYVNPNSHDPARVDPKLRGLAIDLACDLAYASTLIFDLDCAKEQRTTYILDLALLLALLSICVSFSAHELNIRAYTIPREGEPPEGVQKVLHKGINIYQRLERLKKRRQGEELACEGILIVKERKSAKTVLNT